jgi:hypothetical protein
MIELMETIMSFPTQGHYGYPIRLDAFNAKKEWECGTWSDRDFAISFLFDKCELFGYELNNWYTKEDELYVVIVERSFDAKD